MKPIEFHPIADIFPLIPEEDLSTLAEDIKQNGLNQPIVLYEGKVLDGRNRYLACERAGVEPRVEQFTGGSPTSYVISQNLHRRHLSQSQKGMVANDALPFFEAEAKERQLATLKQGDRKPDVALIPQREARSRDQAGALLGVSGRYVSDAKAIAEKSPELAQEVREGKKTIPQARREIKRAEVLEKVQLPSDKYRVLYADPPWKYGDQLTEAYGPTKYHYQSMAISELCEMPVTDIVEENAVLFLWVTSPMLAECWPVIKAWGFIYKTSFVWDKVKHNMGHYNSVRHELLLICTRGSCLPDVPTLIDSVQSIERSDKHSEKPPEFRKIIDTLYPHGKRIELFARGAAPDGWSAYGNQAV